jgi:hypothetical protein
LEIIDVLLKHFNQPLVVRYVSFGAMSEEGKAQDIHCQMSFDAISAFVETKTFRLNTSITSVFHRL